MLINFDQALGNHALAMKLRARRAEVLASNIANADTPGYKARDLDFRAALKTESMKFGMSRTHAAHMSTGIQSADSRSRQPLQKIHCATRPACVFSRASSAR